VVVDQGGVSIKPNNGGRRPETSCESPDKGQTTTNNGGRRNQH
jgi:hypothetical protein